MSRYDTSEDIWSSSSKRAASDARSKTAAGRHSVQKKAKKRNTARIVTNVCLSLVLVASLVLGAAGYLIGYASFADVSTGDNPNDSTSQNEEVLFTGSEHPDVSYFLVVGTDEEDTLTDIMMVVCFDHGRGTASIMQIPRDTFISSNIPSGKVNAVYGSAKKGESQINKLISVINDYFGLPIDHYINVSIDAFREIVDAMGGIDVYVPDYMRAWDKYKQFYYFEEGWHHLNGGEAEAFVRHRASYAKGDIGRVEAQRNFYAAFAKKFISMSYSEMASIATSCYSYIKTDMTVGLLLGYAKEAQKLSLDHILIEAVPGQSGYARPSGMSQELSYFSVHKSEYVNIINAYFMPYDQKISESDLLLVELFNSYSSNIIDHGGTFDEILGEDNQEDESQ